MLIVGRDKYFERVSQFKIEYSDTGNDNDFCPYLENGKEKVRIPFSLYLSTTLFYVSC